MINKKNKIFTNNYLWLIIVFFIYLLLYTYKYQPSKDPFTLITVLYNETDESRIQEYLTCLKKNMHHSMIKKIHVLYDINADNHSNEHPIHDFLVKNNITISYIENRPTFNYCFALAQQYYPNSKIILSNADIYFNETLATLKNYDFKNKLIALTRWDDDGTGAIKPFIMEGKPWIPSQDTWIYETPIKHFWHDKIRIGVFNCEPWIMYHALKNGVDVINPCKTIQCCHLHTSNKRNYTEKDKYPYPPGFIPISWSELT